MREYAIIDDQFPRNMTEFILNHEGIEVTKEFDGKVIIIDSARTYRMSYTTLKVSVYGDIPKEILHTILLMCSPIPAYPSVDKIKADSKHSVKSIHHSIPVLLEDETEYLRQVLLRHKPPKSEYLRYTHLKLKLQEIAEAWE